MRVEKHEIYPSKSVKKLARGNLVIFGEFIPEELMEKVGHAAVVT